MARIRTIKPEFWQNEDLATVSEPALMLAIGLLNHADDQGYFNANPGLIKAACFPLREPSLSLHACLMELSNIGYIELSTGTDGRAYGRVVKFAKHQVINRPSKSRIEPVFKAFTEDSRSPHGALTEPSQQERKGKERKGRDCAGENVVKPKPQTATRFTPPSEEQVREYMARATGPIQPADRDRESSRFRNYHEAKGWKVGTQPMRSWEAAVRTWEGNYKPPARASSVTAEEAREMARL